MSTTFTVRLPKKLLERMRRHSEVNWSEVVRRAIEDYLNLLEEASSREPASRMLERLRELGVRLDDLNPLPVEEEARLYEAARELEWGRLSSTIRAQ